MRKRIGQTICFMMVLGMIMLLGGCKGVKSAKETVFEEGAVFSLPSALQGNVEFNVIGDRVVFYLKNAGLAEGDRQILAWAIGDLNSPESESKAVTYVPEETLAEGRVLGLCLAGDGKIHLLEVGLENGTDSAGYLVIADPDGTVEQKIPVKDTDNIDLKSALFFDDGSFVVYGERNFTLYGPEGVKEYDFEVPGDFNFGDYFGKVSVLNNTGLFFSEDGQDGQRMIYDIKSRSFGDRFTTGCFIAYACAGLGEYDFYATDLSGISGYKADGTLKKEIMNASKSNCAGIRRFYPLDEDTFLVAVLGDGTASMVSIYSKTNQEKTMAKNEIILGTTGLMSAETMDAVKQFNKSGDTYKIVIKDYFEENGKNTEEAENKLKLDIVSGKTPDILLLGPYSNYHIYANKGVFTDLTPYMEKEGISTSDFLPNIVEAGTVNGKYCLFIPDFGIEGACLTKKEFLNKDGFVSLSELMELEQKYNCAGKGVYNLTGGELIFNCSLKCSGQYYNLETGECNFDSAEFVKLLEWSKQYPVKSDASGDYRARYDAVRNNECIMQQFNFSDFHSVNLEDEAAYGNESALTGFPGSSEPGYISVNEMWGISDSSEYKEEAFEFLKYFMSDEYQKDRKIVEMSYVFPSKKSGFDRILKLATEQPKIFNKLTGEYEPAPNCYESNGKNVEAKPMTEKKRDEVEAFILNCNKIGIYDRYLLNIVGDELNKYYAGERSAEKTAEAIQSRVQIYVKEQGY